MSKINEIRLSGTVKDLKMEYDEKFKWYDIDFKLEGVWLCDVPVTCYLCCVSDYPEGLLKEGDQVIVGGHLGHNNTDVNDVKELLVNVQVHEIIHITDIFKR